MVSEQTKILTRECRVSHGQRFGACDECGRGYDVDAIDAAATMGFCLNLLEPQSNGIGGEVPTLIYSAPARVVFAISGMGWSPQAFTIDWCRAQGLDLIPGDGYLPACVPAVVDTWATALAVSRGTPPRP